MTTAPETGNYRLETDTEYWARQRLRDHRIRNPQTGHKETSQETMARLGIESAEELIKVVKNPTTQKEEIAPLTAEELVQKFGDRVLRTVKDPKTGSGRRETVDELAKRLHDGLGVKQDETLWGNYERIDKATGWRNAREEEGKVYAQFTENFIKDEYEKDHESIIPLAKNLPWERFKSILEDKGITREIKLKMWELRRGDYARRIAEIQRKVLAGEIIEGGEEYRRLVLVPYMFAVKNMSSSEFQEFIVWNAPIHKEEGLPYKKKEAIKGGDLPPGQDEENLTFEDLRQTVALWQGSLSNTFVDIKEKKMFDVTEQRNINQRKRSPLTKLRDQWAGIQIIFGNEGNRDVLPIAGGTVDYNAPEAARKWAQNEIAAMNKILNMNIAVESEIEEAKDRLVFARMILDGTRALEGAIPGWENMPQKDRDTKIREAIKELRQPCPGENPGPNEVKKFREELKEKLIRPGNLYYLVDKLITIQGGYPEDAGDPTGVPEWHEGKNPREEAGVMGKRERWSPPTVFGLTAEKFLALIEGQDETEVKALWAQVLIRGSRSLIDSCIVNDNIMNQVSWPEADRLEKINFERKRLYPDEEALPSNPFKNKEVREKN